MEGVNFDNLRRKHAFKLGYDDQMYCRPEFKEGTTELKDFWGVPDILPFKETHPGSL